MKKQKCILNSERKDMKLSERIQKGCIKFKKKEIEPMPASNPPGAPPPPDEPILNTKKDYELDNKSNPKYTDELNNSKKPGEVPTSNKDSFKTKMRDLLKSRPR